MIVNRYSVARADLVAGIRQIDRDFLRIDCPALRRWAI
jgi:hypothetical protein